MTNKNKIDVDWFAETLNNLCSKYTPYQMEHKLHPYIISILQNCGFTTQTGQEFLDSLDVEDGEYKNAKDNVNAIYAVRGDSPEILLNAHMDIIGGKISESSILEFNGIAATELTVINDGVLKFQKIPKQILQKINDIKSFFSERKEMLIDSTLVEQEIVRNGDILRAVNSLIGGDDKCGVAIVLAMAVSSDIPLKITLTSGEERGYGSKLTHSSFYEGVNFSFTPDRRGDNHFIQSIGGYQLCSDEFRNFMMEIGTKYKKAISLQSGAGADPTHIAPFVSECFNCSAGYYNPHSDKEYIVLSEVLSTYNWLFDAMIKIHNGEFKAVRNPVKQYVKKYKDYSASNFWAYRDRIEGPEEEIEEDELFNRYRNYKRGGAFAGNTEIVSASSNLLGKLVKASPYRYSTTKKPNTFNYNNLCTLNKFIIGICNGIKREGTAILVSMKVLDKYKSQLSSDVEDDTILLDKYSVSAIGEEKEVDEKGIAWTGNTVRVNEDYYDYLLCRKGLSAFTGTVLKVVSGNLMKNLLLVEDNANGNVVCISSGYCDTITSTGIPIIRKSYRSVKPVNIGYVSMKDFSSDREIIVASFPFSKTKEGFLISNIAKSDFRALTTEEQLEVFSE